MLMRRTVAEAPRPTPVAAPDPIEAAWKAYADAAKVKAEAERDTRAANDRLTNARQRYIGARQRRAPKAEAAEIAAAEDAVAESEGALAIAENAELSAGRKASDARSVFASRVCGRFKRLEPIARAVSS